MSIVVSAVPGFDTLDFIFAVPGRGVFFPDCCHPLKQCHKLMFAVPSSVSGFRAQLYILPSLFHFHCL